MAADPVALDEVVDGLAGAAAEKRGRLVDAEEAVVTVVGEQAGDSACESLQLFGWKYDRQSGGCVGVAGGVGTWCRAWTGGRGRCAAGALGMRVHVCRPVRGGWQMPQTGRPLALIQSEWR